jgi:hypothetical protein
VVNAWKDFAVEIAGGEPVVTFRGERIPFARSIVLRWEPGLAPVVRVSLVPRSARSASVEERRVLAILIGLMRAAGVEIDETDPESPRPSYHTRRVHLRGTGNVPACKAPVRSSNVRVASRERFAETPTVDRCSACDRKFRGAAKA